MICLLGCLCGSNALVNWLAGRNYFTGALSVTSCVTCQPLLSLVSVNFVSCVSPCVSPVSVVSCAVPAISGISPPCVMCQSRLCWSWLCHVSCVSLGNVMWKSLTHL